MFLKWKEKAKKLKQEIYTLYLAYKDLEYHGMEKYL